MSEVPLYLTTIMARLDCNDIPVDMVTASLSSCLLSSIELSDMSLKYEPASEPLHISAKQVFFNRELLRGVISLNRPESQLTNFPGHVWHEKWTALLGTHTAGYEGIC